MSKRDIFGDGKLFGGEGEPNIEYNPPEEKLFDTGLVNRLVEQYISDRDKGRLSFWWECDFNSEVQELESIIKKQSGKPRPQFLIDSLTVMLKDESDGLYFSRSMYLTAVIQVLYNLNQGNEFVINIRNWHEGEYHVGWYLKGSEKNPFTLNLYGNFRWAGFDAEHCKFTFHDVVDLCGYFESEHCRFDFMPDAEIKKYLAEQSKVNVLRRMNDKGEWETIQPASLDR